jgi:hypothetical protein
VFVDTTTLNYEEVSRHERDVISSLKKSDKYRRENSVPWRVLINSMQKKPPLTHDTSLEISEASDAMNPR